MDSPQVAPTSPTSPDRSAQCSVRVNGEERSVEAGSTLAELLRALGLAERRLAVAVNREVVPRGQHGRRVLAEDDRIEILEAVGGG